MGDIPYDAQPGNSLNQLGYVCEVQKLFSRASQAGTSTLPTAQEEESIPGAGPARTRFSARIEALNKDEGTSRKRKKITTSTKVSKRRLAEVEAVKDVGEDEGVDEGAEEERPARKRARVAGGEESLPHSGSSRRRAVTGRVDVSAKENVDPVGKVSTFYYLSSYASLSG